MTSYPVLEGGALLPLSLALYMHVAYPAFSSTYVIIDILSMSTTFTLPAVFPAKLDGFAMVLAPDDGCT